jgi:cbb3-type cytochrome oxidase subunit 3
MKLSDIMSAMHLEGWAELALVLFLAAFIAVALQLFSPKRRAEYKSKGLLPLEGDVDEVETSEGKP